MLLSNYLLSLYATLWRLTNFNVVMWPLTQSGSRALPGNSPMLLVVISAPASENHWPLVCLWSFAWRLISLNKPFESGFFPSVWWGCLLHRGHLAKSLDDTTGQSLRGHGVASTGMWQVEASGAAEHVTGPWIVSMHPAARMYLAPNVHSDEVGKSHCCTFENHSCCHGQP